MLKAIGISVGVLAVVGVLGVGGWYVTALTAVATAPAKIITKVADPDHILNSYETFFDQYNQYKAGLTTYQNNVQALKDYEASLGPDRSKWTFDQNNEWSRLNSLVMGARNGLNDIVASYDAAAEKADVGIFRDHNLPDHLDPVT